MEALMELAPASLTLFLLSVTTIFLAYLLTSFLSPFLLGKSAAREPPSVPGLPIIGGALKFLAGPLKLIEDAYAQLGSVFCVHVLHKKIVFLVGPEVSAHFFKAQEEELSQKEVYGFNVPTFGPGVVFDVDYATRKEQFRFFAEALKTAQLRAYVDIMVQEAQEFFGNWKEEGEVNLLAELGHLIILTASRCLLGREVREGMFKEVSSLFHDLDMGMQPISVFLPYLPIPAHRTRDRARQRLADVFSDIIRKRKASGKKEDDMLQVFIDSTYRATGRQTTEEEVTGLLIAALFAGQHTSSITSTWTGAYILREKEIYFTQLEEEQKRILSEQGGRLDYDVLNGMDTLHLCMKEALRLHPPLIMLMRYVLKPFTVKSREGVEYDVKKGSIVATSPAFAGRLSHVFKDPDKYDPDRYLPGREEDKRQPFSYVAFGGGRHGCMGETFAYMQVKAIWSLLIRNFDLQLLTPMPSPNYKAMVVGPKEPVMVRYRKRKLSAS